MPSRRRRELTLRDLFPTRSAAMKAALALAEKVVDRDVSVLLAGESGVGKDYLAQALHACSRRRDHPFVHIDCAAIPFELFESELFGYEKGTFTDAATRKAGRLELARAGTVYFDGIASLDPSLQAKLLRAIQERSFSRLGGTETIVFDARLISSVSEPPARLVEAGRLRSDLLYRINTVTIELPALRDRREDIPLLARAFLRQTRDGRKRRLGADVLGALASAAWPGNLRQLKNAVDHAALVSEGAAIAIDALPTTEPRNVIDQGVRESWTLEELEASYIREVLRKTRRNFSRAAAILGISRKTLLEKRRRYAID